MLVALKPMIDWERAASGVCRKIDQESNQTMSSIKEYHLHTFHLSSTMSRYAINLSNHKHTAAIVIVYLTLSDSESITAHNRSIP